MPARSRLDFHALRFLPEGMSAAEVIVKEVDPLGQDALAATP